MYLLRTLPALLLVSVVTPLNAAWADRAAAQQDTLVVRLLHAGSQPDFQGTDVSPDGQYLTQRAPKPAGNLDLLDLLTGQQTHVTTDPPESDKYSESAQFSPDGKSIAFVLYNAGRYEIRVIGSDGSAERVVLPSDSETWDWAYLHDWSADAASLLLTFYKRGARIARTALLSVEDGTYRVLTEFPASQAPSAVAFSPDGKFIAYDTQGDIFLLAQDGGSPKSVLSGQGQDEVVGWGPGGRDLLVKRGRRATDEIWLLSIADGQPSGEPRLIREDLPKIEAVGIASGRLYYGTTASKRQLFTADIDLDAEIITVEPSPLPLSHGETPGPAAWSLQGEQLAYSTSSPDGTGWRLNVHSADTDQSDVIASLPSPVSHLWWGADGNGFLLSAIRGLYEVDPRSGTVGRYLRTKDVVRWAVLTADRDIAFYAEWEGPRESPDRGHFFKRHDLSTGTVVHIARLDTLPSGLATVRDVDLSPDGTRLAFRGFSFDKNLWTIGVVETATGEVRELVSQDPAENDSDVSCRLVSWTAGGDNIVYAREITGQTDCSLYRIPASGGTAVEVGRFPSHPNNWTTTFSGDRSRVAFLHGRDYGEVWVMENIPWTAGP